MYSANSNRPLQRLGFPIRKSPDQSLLTAPRGSIVVRHVLLRLLVPRHPPCALISLTNVAHPFLISFGVPYGTRSSITKDSRLIISNKHKFVELDSLWMFHILSYPVIKVQDALLERTNAARLCWPEDDYIIV